MASQFDQRWQNVNNQVNIVIGQQRDPGWPPIRRISEWSWHELGVHPAVDTYGLPEYLPRLHDEVIDAALDPDSTASRLVVLRGDSSTGKSRALYRAVTAGRFASWRLARPSSAHGLRELLGSTELAPQTIVWLGELRDYVGQPETSAAFTWLGGILAQRTGLIAVTTIWHDYWHRYTAVNYDGSHQYPELRDLLSGLPELQQPAGADTSRGAVIDVPPYFTERDLELASRTGDPSLASAIRAAEDGGRGRQVIQYLAGVPQLRAHYQDAEYRSGGLGKAVLTAAMDAARLADARQTGEDFLQEAAWGYLSDEQRADAPGDWIRIALADATATLRGGLRALTPLQPVSQRKERRYQLADVLHQDARHRRAEIIPPPAFFAAARHTGPAITALLGQAAAARGLLRTAAALYRASGPHDVDVAERLIRLMHAIDPADPRPAAWCCARIDLEPGWKVSGFASLLKDTGSSDQLTVLADRINLDDAYGVASLLQALRLAGELSDRIALADRAVARVSLSSEQGTEELLKELGNSEQGRQLVRRIVARDDLGRTEGLVAALRTVGADQQATGMADRIAVETQVVHLHRAARLMRELANCGFARQATVLASRAACQASPDDDKASLADLLRALKEVGAVSTRDMLARRLVTHSDLRDSGTAGWLMYVLREARSPVVGLAVDRAVTLADLDDPDAVRRLAEDLAEHGFVRQAVALANRAAAGGGPRELATHMTAILRAIRGNGWSSQPLLAGDQSSLDSLADHALAHANPRDVRTVSGLLEEKRKAGRLDLGKQSASVVRDAAVHADMSDLAGVAAMIRELGQWGPSFSRVSAVLADNAVSQAEVNDPRAAAALIEVLHDAGLDAHSAALAERAARHTELNDPDALAYLVRELRYAKTQSPMTVLLNRDPAALVGLSSLDGLKNLLKQLRWAQADAHVSRLADRVAANAELDDLSHMGSLLEEMRECGTKEHAAALAKRVAAHMKVNLVIDRFFFDRYSPLLWELRRNGVGKQDNEIIDEIYSRLPAAGDFLSFTRVHNTAEMFRYGREIDGSPTAPWNWDSVESDVASIMGT